MTAREYYTMKDNIKAIDNAVPKLLVKLIEVIQNG
jgi:hypothetical protein